MSRVLAALASHAQEEPDGLALTGDRIALTWAELAQAVAFAVQWLEPHLLKTAPGAPVAIALDNGPAWVVLDLALLALGRPSLPLPPFFTAEQRGHALTDAGAGMLVRLARPGEHGAAFIAAEPVAAESLSLPPGLLHNGVAKITYTSGSTGRPKGVCLSLAQMEDVAEALVDVLGRETAKVHMAVLPLGVLLENVAGLYPTLLAGGRYHAPSLRSLGFGQGSRPDISRLCAAVAAARATSLILVPEILREMLQWMGDTGIGLPSLGFIAVGGAKTPPSLIAAARAAGLPVYEGYGLSECASVVALNMPERDRPGSVGRPLPNLTLTVRADGELVVGPHPFLGYVGEPAAKGPWRTGDLGAIDDDGFVSISGRRSNLLITAFGRNVAPEWVESELLAQPEIGQALVFGEGARALCAVLVPSAAAIGPTALDAAVERANAGLPDYARVGRWQASRPFGTGPDELTGNGRPRRDVLRAAHQDFIESEG